MRLTNHQARRRQKIVKKDADANSMMQIATAVTWDLKQHGISKFAAQKVNRSPTLPRLSEHLCSIFVSTADVRGLRAIAIQTRSAFVT